MTLEEIRRSRDPNLSMRTPNWFLISICHEVGNFNLGIRMETAILGALEMCIAESRARWTKAEEEVKRLKERLALLGKTNP